MAHASSRLLKLALPLVKEHGFTRETLARSALFISEPPATPLSDSAVSALFGEGDNARRTLVNAWLEEGREQMKLQPSKNILEVLSARLKYNEPVLPSLPEAFALLGSPRSGLPPLDVRPALRHATAVADEACHIVGDTSVGPAWYAKRASLAAVYAAAELHQLTSPDTSRVFLASLLASSSSINTALTEVELFGSYVAKSWRNIRLNE
ncbi:hypothetical protein OF83DRAFT_599056 [Amylostereum chailletii]|nr:hypothetical protein OF83DRAFT_599056 [Amylostereum chailletii]